MIRDLCLLRRVKSQMNKRAESDAPLNSVDGCAKLGREKNHITQLKDGSSSISLQLVFRDETHRVCLLRAVMA